MSQRLLLIAYQFPPVGGAGVQRVAKLSKYLPHHGWSVSVLTAKNHSVPTTDSSLCADVPSETVIRKARSFEPGYRVKQAVSATPAAGGMKGRVRGAIGATLRRGAAKILQPDPQILWAPAAIRQGRRLLREARHDAIMVSGPPFSSFLVGAALQRSSGLPLVLDYRDEWGLANRYLENRDDTPVTRWFQGRLQKWVLGHASTVIATTKMSADALRQQARVSGYDVPVRCIYNGFDPEDLEGGVPRRCEWDRLRLSHVGTLWRLTTPRPLVAAVQHLARSQPRLASRLDLELVGRCTPDESDGIDHLRQLPCRVLRRDYVDHSAAVNVMQQADELCLLLADVPGGERVVPGKTFEYLAANRRILAVVPNGETRNLLSSFAGVTVFAPHQVEQIAKYLGESIQAVNERRGQSFQRPLTQFDRRAQAGEMAGILESLVARRQSFVQSYCPSPPSLTS